MVETNCKQCGTVFEARPADLIRGHAKFCSLSCSNTARAEKQTPNTVCAGCSVEFYRPKHDKRSSRSGLYFCCRECKDKAQRIGGLKEIQPNHYGTGYKVKAWALLPHYCNRCFYNEYVEILCVHHKDHNHCNNEIDNLELLCPNCHAIEHLVINKSFGDKAQRDR